MKISQIDFFHILDQTSDLWEYLCGSRIFITGGKGFFGCWLLESFLFANQQLDLKASASVLTRKPDSVRQASPHLMLDSATTLRAGDVRNFEFPKGEYSLIIHAATEANTQLGELAYSYDRKYMTYSHIGYNLKVTDMQAAVGLAQIQKVEQFIKGAV